MLSRAHRLTSKKDYSRIFDKGRPFRATGLMMKVVTNGLQVSRIGFVVSTKVAKRAVVRNRLKRRMREHARRLIGLLPPGLDIVFIARPEAAKFEFKEVIGAMNEALRRARLPTV